MTNSKRGAAQVSQENPTILCWPYSETTPHSETTPQVADTESDAERYVHPVSRRQIRINKDGHYAANSNVLWWAKISEKYQHFFSGKIRAIEFGSAIIKPHKRKRGKIGSGATATLRDFFGNVDEYVGVDWRDTAGVDVVSLAHEYKSRRKFDIVCSASMLEHDPYWAPSIDNMCRLLKKSGVLMLSWGAALNRPHCLNEAPDSQFHKLQAGLVFRLLRKNGMYIHEFQYECNFPWRDRTFHVGEGNGEVVLVACKDAKRAMGPCVIDDLLVNDEVSEEEFVLAYGESYRASRDKKESSPPQGKAEKFRV